MSDERLRRIEREREKWGEAPPHHERRRHGRVRGKDVVLQGRPVEIAALEEFKVRLEVPPGTLEHLLPEHQLEGLLIRPRRPWWRRLWAWIRRRLWRS